MSDICILTGEPCSLHPAGLEPSCFEGYRGCPNAIRFMGDYKLHLDIYTEDAVRWLRQEAKSLPSALPFLKRCFKAVIDYLEGN